MKLKSAKKVQRGISMDAEELRKQIEARGYEVKAIRVFKKTFHVTFWASEYKAKAFYKVPLEQTVWEDIEQDFPLEG